MEKSILENVALPDVTSGTLDKVFAVAEQVTSFWIAVTTSATSPGRAVLPTTKQALAWRAKSSVVGRAVEAERMLRMVSAEAVDTRILM